MRARRVGLAAWLLLAACLYFFENNTGTRAVLLLSVLFALVPRLRALFLRPDGPEKAETGKRPAAARGLSQVGEEEPGDVRPYVPGDPVRRIHWKLSAKRDELLVREEGPEREDAETEDVPGDGRAEREDPTSGENRGKRIRRRLALTCAAGALLCALLTALLPEARAGAQALCNRLFEASEAVNAYAYEHFPVPQGQATAAAAVLMLCAAGFAAAAAALRNVRAACFTAAAACTLFQVYFGLAFPAWVLLPLYTLFALGMLSRPAGRKGIAACIAAVLLVSGLTALLLPGTDAATEAASEAARDRLSRLAELASGAPRELPEGETEVRHAHTLSLESGSREARTERAYRLVTVDEEQISMPHWADWLRTALLLLLTVLLLVLPFTPFLVLNARRKKAEEARKQFASGNVGEAVQAVFRQVTAWLEATGHGGGNRLYRDWTEQLPACMPEGYAGRFARCAEDFEEAVYSGRELPEEKRQAALDLLEETGKALWKTADRKQRLLLKYWMCMYE